VAYRLGTVELTKAYKVIFCKPYSYGYNSKSEGGKKEPKHIDPYLEVLVEEIIFLSGSTIYDAYRKAPFQAKVEIMIYILDYLWKSFLFNWRWLLPKLWMVHAEGSLLQTLA